jgi:serine/threonine protein kinase
MKQIGDFKLERELGRGATAQVFLARRMSMGASEGEEVALKVFHPGLWDREELKRRALAEFKTVAALDHPNIVRMIEPLWDLSEPAVAMEYVNGASLEDFQSRLPYVLPEVALLIVIEVLRALEHAHSKGVIHRDLKPANILIGTGGTGGIGGGRVLVSDFGLAKMTDMSRLTLSGTILGSPDFMSPEQARGDLTSPRSDLFAVSGILYFLVTGTRPFTRHSPLATLAAVSDAKCEAVQSRNPKVSGSLAAMIHKGLSKDPNDRFTTAAEFRGQLESYLDALKIGSSSEFSFQAWMKHPNDTVLSAMKAMTEALCLRAEKLLLERRWDEFVSALSHLSLVAPESGAIPRLMDEYQKAKERNLPRRFWISAAVAALLLTFGGIYLKLRSDTSSLKAPLQSGQFTQPMQNAARPKPEAQMAQVSRGAETRISKSRQLPRKETVVRKTDATNAVRFDVPAGVQVYWNGSPVDPTQPLLRQSAGNYQVKLVKEGYPSISQLVTVKNGEPTVIRVR